VQSIRSANGKTGRQQPKKFFPTGLAPSPQAKSSAFKGAEAFRTPRISMAFGYLIFFLQIMAC
jgi:hypothetical protein